MSWMELRRNISEEIGTLFIAMAEAALPEPLLDEHDVSQPQVLPSESMWEVARLQQH